MQSSYIQNPEMQNSYIDNCLGYNRHECLQALLVKGVESVAFGHWLAIPSQQLLLVFRYQHCVAINSY